MGEGGRGKNRRPGEGRKGERERDGSSKQPCSKINSRKEGKQNKWKSSLIIKIYKKGLQ